VPSEYVITTPSVSCSTVKICIKLRICKRYNGQYAAICSILNKAAQIKNFSDVLREGRICFQPLSRIDGKAFTFRSCGPQI